MVGSGADGDATALEFELMLVREVAADEAGALDEVVEAAGKRLRMDSMSLSSL